jgi:hypothetical protein
MGVCGQLEISILLAKITSFLGLESVFTISCT